MRYRYPGHGGYVAIDAMFGLIIICVVAVLLAKIVQQEHATESELADSRSALRTAEHALLNLQHGQPMPPLPADTHLSLQPANGGIAPAGSAWAAVQVSVHRHSRRLVGIVPAASLRTREANS